MRRRHTIILILLIAASAGVILFDVLSSEHNTAWQHEQIDGVIEYPGLISSVQEGEISYAETPPVGGAHAAITQACGIYRVPVSDPNAVASLATGAVWLAYNPDLPQAEIDALYDWAIGERDLIVAPYPGLPAPIVVTAWGAQLSVDSAADARLVPFFVQYKNAPSAPFPDQHCIDGLGIPTE